MQNYTSANTSINKAKVPAIFKKLPWGAGQVNLDLGGGKYDTASEYLEQFGTRNLVYDPYNRSALHNMSVQEELFARGGADSVTISNVLNVIDDEEARLEVLDFAKHWLHRNGECFITVYEGDRSSIGRQTGKDQWQNNMPLKAYLQEVRAVFPNASIMRGMIVASRG